MDEHEAPEAVSFTRSPESPPRGKPNALNLRLVDGRESSVARPAAPLMLYGSYSISADVTERYSGRIAMSVRAVAVSRETGRVFLGRLLRSEDHAPIFRGGKPGPGANPLGAFESGQFSVDLDRHLGLPDAAGEFDVFLWLEDIASEMATGRKPAGAGTSAGANEFERQPRIASIKPVASADGPSVAAGPSRVARQIVGTTGTGRVSIVAYAVEAGAAGWTVIGTPDAGPFAFDIDVARLLPDAGPKDRVLVFAIGGGRRSAVLDLR